ncbi:MAG: L,D-transpeptidase, partial [Rubrivivax sp.]
EGPPPGAATSDGRLPHPAALTRVFATEVQHRLEVPADEQARYACALLLQLDRARVCMDRPQWLVLVDRSAQVQAAMVWWVDAAGATGLVGATPASTGRPWGFEHFATPLGVFAHTLENPDFRAEGTVNALGIRGYGERGMRVYDFGWVLAERGWAPGSQPMRLQLHATDPLHLEPRLGTRASKGCIRVPARLNTLLDRWGVLDADYDAAAAATGRGHWVLRPDRILTPWAGRWLVVVETDRAQRPAWTIPTGLRP